MSTVINIVLDQGGSNELIVYSTLIEEIFNKKLTAINPPQSTANWSSGPKATRIVDLLRIEERFSVTGYIDEGDKSKIKDLFKQGGVFNMTYEDGTISINMDKLTLSKETTENDERGVQFTCIKGVNI